MDSEDASFRHMCFVVLMMEAKINLTGKYLGAVSLLPRKGTAPDRPPD